MQHSDFLIVLHCFFITTPYLESKTVAKFRSTNSFRLPTGSYQNMLPEKISGSALLSCFFLFFVIMETALMSYFYLVILLINSNPWIFLNFRIFRRIFKKGTVSYNSGLIIFDGGGVGAIDGVCASLAPSFSGAEPFSLSSQFWCGR